jgi:ribosome recycling factor
MIKTIKFLANQSRRSNQLSRLFAKKKKNAQKQDKDSNPEPTVSEIDLNLTELQFQEITDDFSFEISQLSFGTLQPSMLEEIEVQAYDDICTIQDLSQVVPKNEKTVLLNIYDPGVFENVKTALDICELDLALRPDQDGLVVSLANTNSKEAKDAFCKGVKNKGDKTVEELRSLRHDEIKEVKGLGGFGEDDLYQAEKEIHQMYLDAVQVVQNQVKSKIESV